MAPGPRSLRIARTVSGTLILALEARAALMTGAMYGLSRTSKTSVKQATWLAWKRHGQVISKVAHVALHSAPSSPFAP
jgi:hypothetical protein